MAGGAPTSSTGPDGAACSAADSAAAPAITVSGEDTANSGAAKAGATGSGVAEARGLASTAPFSSSRMVWMGLKLVAVEAATSRLRFSNSLRTSSSSASRIASLNCDWNSPARRRILAVIWPTVRNAFGKSLGPMTISATPPITITSPQLMSSMVAPDPLRSERWVRPRADGSTELAVGEGRGGADRLRALMVDRADRLCRRHGRRGGRGGRILVAHALLEGFDALGDIAHHLGDLAAPEQEHDDRADDDPVPDACATHGGPPRCQATRRAPGLNSRPQPRGGGPGRQGERRSGRGLRA